MSLILPLSGIKNHEEVVKVNFTVSLNSIVNSQEDSNVVAVFEEITGGKSKLSTPRLAKAILNMPDEIDLFERSTLVASWITGETIQLVAVDPRNTSRGKHLGCPADPPGNIRRTKGQYDIGICTGCNQPVNTHNHAAKKIRARAVKQLQEQVEKLH